MNNSQDKQFKDQGLNVDLLTDLAFPISALVARYGVAAQSLRNWEEQGLIPAAHRTPGGHRRYSSEHIDALDRLFTLSIDALMSKDRPDTRQKNAPTPGRQME